MLVAMHMSPVHVLVLQLATVGQSTSSHGMCIIDNSTDTLYTFTAPR